MGKSYKDNPAWKKHCTYHGGGKQFEIPCWVALGATALLLSPIVYFIIDCFVLK